MPEEFWARISERRTPGFTPRRLREPGCFG